MNSFENTIGYDPGLHFNAFTSVRNGILGQDTDLPFNDFLHTGGNIVSVYFDSPVAGNIWRQNVRARSATDPLNEMKCAIYTKTGPNSGNDLTISPDTVSFDTSLSILRFTQSKVILPSTGYWLTYQAKSDWYFCYDSSVIFQYAFLNNAPFGNFSATFTGVTTFQNVCQFWCDYTY